MKMFFDTEFTGLKKDTDLISFGAVLSNGKKFYAEFTDYDLTKCDDWVVENVVRKTMTGGNKDLEMFLDSAKDTYLSCGPKKVVKSDLIKWVSEIDEQIELVSDVCQYDMVLFQDIFGGAFDVPHKFTRCCHDINQDIARVLNLREDAAFDVDREIFLKLLNRKWEFDNQNKHNALHDAEVIRYIYERIGRKI